MKLSELVTSYISSSRQKAKLNCDIELDNGHIFKEGTESDFLIPRGPNHYHFEADNEACLVTKDEVTIIEL